MQTAFDNWTTTNNLSAEDGLDLLSSETDNVYIGQYSFKLTGQANTNKFIKQRINFFLDATDRIDDFFNDKGNRNQRARHYDEANRNDD